MTQKQWRKTIFSIACVRYTKKNPRFHNTPKRTCAQSMAGFHKNNMDWNGLLKTIAAIVEN